MDGGAWWATVHGVAESDTTKRLHFTLHFGIPTLSGTRQGCRMSQDTGWDQGQLQALSTLDVHVR